MDIWETMDKLERLRKHYTLCSKVALVGFLLFMGSIFMVAIFKDPQLAIWSVVGLFIAVSPLVIGQSNIKYKFDKIYKKEFVKTVLEEELGEVDYQWKKGFAKKQVENFSLVQSANRFGSSDYLKAQYRGVGFEQADVRITMRTKKNNNTIPYFIGRMIKLDVSFKTISTVQVFSKAFRHRALAGIDMKEVVDTEDVAFNKQFDVYAAKEHDAFYALTPQIMEKLKELANRYESIAIRMEADGLYIAINTLRDTFDANVFKQLNFFREMDLLREDVRDITDIIDILKLESK